MGTEIKCRCPFWLICGGGIFHLYWAQQTYPHGDQRRDWIGTVCNDESKHLECQHYKIRIKLKEGKLL